MPRPGWAASTPIRAARAGWSSTCPRSFVSDGFWKWARRTERLEKMAKAQAVKPKSSSSFGDWFKRIGAKPAPAPAARPGATSPGSTTTNLKAAAAGTAPAARRKVVADEPARGALEGFRLPFIGARPVLAQLQFLGAAALAIIVLLALVAYQDTTARTRSATHISILSQMQFHTQRLAKAAGLAARGQTAAFPQLQDSREQFADYLKILRDGGFALVVDVASAATHEQLATRLTELEKRWPDSSSASGAILAAQKDLVQLAQNISQLRGGAEEMATLSQSLTGLMAHSGASPAQVLKGNRITILSERLGRGAAEILGSDVIDPEVPFLIGKDTNELREILRGLETGNDSMGVAPVRDAEARAKLAELKKQFQLFEQNAQPILREMQKLVTARQAGAQLVAASEQLQAAVRAFQDSLQGERSVARVDALVVLGALLLGVLALTALVFVADTRRRAAQAETENKRNQEAILRLLNEMGDLADGDLTIRAQVTEDITGAIADSMNYTIDELRTLVTGVNNAAIQVTQKTAQAQSISPELPAPAERHPPDTTEPTPQRFQH